MRLISIFALLLPACEADKDGPTEDTGAEVGDTAEESRPPWNGDTSSDGIAEDTGPAIIPAVVLSAEATWTLSFDETAEAAGFADCTYSRTYEGVQVLDLDYLCPACSFLVSGTSVMSDGADCYIAVFGEENAGDRAETWGVSADNTLWRSTQEQFSLGELAAFEPGEEGADIAIAWSSDYTMEVGGAMTLSAAGLMRYQTDESVLLQDPWPARTEPYACGWPQNDPGTLTLDYTLEEGSTFPNVRLVDQCDEKLALWDLYGSYLVIDISEPDCGPCRSMADTSESFASAMEEAGVPVYVVSMLGNGLSVPYETPSAATFNEWVYTYALTDPVLYDRGFAYALIPGFAEAFTGEDFGYPTWIVVDPEMRVMHANVGFRSWDDVAAIVVADWESR